MMTDYAPPPRGWLYGVVLAISAFWLSSVTWEAIRNHEIGVVKLIGVVILLISLVIIGYEAFTDDNFKTAKATLIARRRLLPFGLALIIIGDLLYH